MSDVTRILSEIESGDPMAAEQLLPLVYAELRKLAAAKLSHEKPGQTLQPTVLVHEAYVRLVDADESKPWNGRGHFFAAAAETMRRILIENARRKRSERHGGNLRRVNMDSVNPEAEGHDDKLLALDEALGRLEHRWPDDRAHRPVARRANNRCDRLVGPPNPPPRSRSQHSWQYRSTPRQSVCAEDFALSKLRGCA